MTPSPHDSEPPAGTAAAGWPLPILLVLFAGSGCSALIYEVVWFQLLQLVIGSSGVSLAILLGTFMGGLCLGSLLVPRLTSRRHPLLAYAGLELGIGVLGMLVPLGLPLVDQLYSGHAGHGYWGILLRGVVAGVCLLPPAVLMGGTLPVAARWLAPVPRSSSWVGLCYGANTLGAVAGCLLAGFYLLRAHDLPTATHVAAAVNAVVAAGACALAARTAHRPAPDRPPAAPGDGRGRGPVYLVIALSGFSGLAAEVIWTRLLALTLGGTVYTFSIILAVFLVGLGVGGVIGSVLARRSGRPRALLGACQLVLAAAVAWAGYELTRSIPYWPIVPGISQSPWFTFRLDLLRCLWAVSPAAVCWGASFPLALAAATPPGHEPAGPAGRVYAANTVGAIAGAVAAGLVLLPQLGTQHTQRLLIGVSAAAGLLLLVRGAAPGAAATRLVPRIATALGALVAAGLAVLLAWWAPPVPGELIAWGRNLPTNAGQSKVLYAGEGVSTSVAVTEFPSGVRAFHVAGKAEASSAPQDMRLQRMLGHLPALLHPRARSVLVVGCGCGATAGSFVLHPGVERVVVCEIEPLVPRVAAEYFAAENDGLFGDPRVELVLDDARHYLAGTGERFDVITSDPIHPWLKGSAALYTREYFELCRGHLNPGGFVTQWVPLYESDLAAVKSEVATFVGVFPDATVWGNTLGTAGYDTVLLGQEGPARIDVGEIDHRLGRPDHAGVIRSLERAGFRSLWELLGTYAGRGPELAPWLRDAEVNRDRDLRLQYLAGLGANVYRGKVIYDEMLEHRRFPDDLFVAPPEVVQVIRQHVHRTGRE